jgi:DNA-binding NtrC family response regulator
VAVDVRVIAATNRSLDRMIRDGQFREDLYYRLQVIEIRVPPLRERTDEILPLVEFFLFRYAARYGRTPARPSPALRHALVTYAWPGNVRELENVIKRFVILQDETLVLGELTHPRHAAETATIVPVEPSSIPSAPSTAMPAANTPVVAEEPANWVIGTDAASSMTLPDLARRAAQTAERDAIQQTLDRLRWNRRKAARQLGVSYKTLLNKMKECGIGAPVEVSADS